MKEDSQRAADKWKTKDRFIDDRKAIDDDCPAIFDQDCAEVLPEQTHGSRPGTTPVGGGRTAQSRPVDGTGTNDDISRGIKSFGQLW